MAARYRVPPPNNRPRRKPAAPMVDQSHPCSRHTGAFGAALELTVAGRPNVDADRYSAPVRRIDFQQIRQGTGSRPSDGG
jgi:hypothetical protein